MTCRELWLKSLKVAENLSKLGICKGDHVTIIAEHRNDLAAIFIGTLAHGAVINPLHVGFTARKWATHIKWIEL